MKLTLSKSLMSVATATLLVTAFAGCNNSESTNTQAVVNQNEQSQYSASVSGAVMDDMGRPVEGATVAIAGQTTTTDASGMYNFTEVPVNSAIAGQLESGDFESESTVSCGETCGMTVSVTAGEGYNTAFARVSTFMIHIENGGTGSDEYSDTGDINTQPNSQSFTLHSDVGIVMLSRPIASVAGTVRMEDTGEAIPAGTKIVAVYTGVGITANPGFSDSWDVVNDVSSVNSITGTIGENGAFQLDGLLTSSEYKFIVEGYVHDVANHEMGIGGDETAPYAAGINTDNSAAYVDGDFVTHTGNVYVVPITANDIYPPLVASVSDSFGLIDGSLMLYPDVTNQITINFTESMTAGDITSYVKVYSGATAGEQLAVTSAAVSGKQLVITLAESLAGRDGEPLEVYIQREARLRDLAGNYLGFTDIESTDSHDMVNVIDLGADCADGCDDGTLDYLSCTAGGRVIKFDLMTYKEMNTAAEAANDGVQMELDTDVNRTASSEVDPVEAQTEAFNNVIDSDVHYAQLNNVSEEDDDQYVVSGRLTALAQAMTGDTDVEVETDVTRIRFVPHEATTYEVMIPSRASCTTDTEWISVESGTCGVSTDGSHSSVTISGFVPGEPVELIINGVYNGDDIVITPYDDLCKPGTPYALNVVDNVAPTTVLQNSYCVAEDAPLHGGLGEIVRFGNGGELTNGFGDPADLGIPALYITPGLLDNLDADGHNILGENQYTAADNTLDAELYEFNWAENNYTNQDVYDATDYVEFAKALARTVGVAFSEDLKEDQVVPAEYDGTNVVSGSYKVVNNVTVNDTGTGIDEVDLVSFDTDNVLSLANNNDGEVMSFAGIMDLNSNAADMGTHPAEVALIDGMPPFITKAIFDGEKVVINFNEAVALADGVTLMVEGGVDKNITYDETTSPATWVLSDANKTLTITSTDLNASDFSSDHEYDESDIYALDEDVYKHAVLHFNEMEDVHGNSWNDWNGTKCVGEVATPTFAMISAIGDFKVIEVDNAEFKVSNTAQAISWTFNQAVRTGDASDFFSSCGDSETNTTLIDQWFKYTNGGDHNLSDVVSDITFHLTTDCKTIELTFDYNGTTAGDQVATKAGHVFTSSVDETQNEIISASANAD